jgi:hypothetical protein
VQILAPFAGGPDEYFASAGERRMQPPASCPNCGSKRRLRFHGYYERYVSSEATGDPLSLKIRRYRCRDCLLTTSLLPCFCFSYRMLRGDLVANYFRGDGLEARDAKWLSLLRIYHRRFESWIPQLTLHLQEAFSFTLNHLTCRASWRRIELHLGSCPTANGRILSKSGVTLLGCYSCHRPKLRSGDGGDHRHVLFSSGKDPPM